ncbi:MAG: sodium-dependent transporter [Gammaproteobacteria bacterium SHHR-1]|uniref:sodium-dependent transporter n=1 Tax=Magnetovirga frankeli TaxID=947516 RepID=UPI001292EB02|nr:sodium-dependent transporter [gamma proteobacterium SS-5]
MTERTSMHGQWSSRLAFILAATGSAVGLGNIWKFPYITGEYGGGAFVLVYLACVVAIGLPVMIAEVLIGRRGRQSPINTMRCLAKEAGRSRVWSLLGWTGVLAGFLILSYYSVIAGWAMAYVFKAGSGVLQGLDGAAVGSVFSALVSDPVQLVFWHSLFMLMTGLVIARGVQSGLERAVRVLMPALFALLLVLLGYALTSGGVARGFDFLFSPDLSKLSTGAILTAMGHAFFTLSLGMGAIMMYGSYLPQDASIAKTSLVIAGLDTLVALLAGMVIFPIVFANGLEPGAGPGLIFQTLPIAFGQMPWGGFFGTLFFLLLVFAAWSSAISLIEPAVAWLVENHDMGRARATLLVALSTWFLGLASVLSFSDWAFDFSFLGAQKENGIFDILDLLTSNFMLPLGGLAMALFATWVMRRADVVEELAMGDGAGFRGWYYLARYVTPVGLVFIFLNGLGLL